MWEKSAQRFSSQGGVIQPPDEVEHHGKGVMEETSCLLYGGQEVKTCN